MFVVVTEEDEAAIRAVYERRGEFAQLPSSCASGFRGITDNAQAPGVRADHRQLEAAGAAAGEVTPKAPRLPRVR